MLKAEQRKDYLKIREIFIRCHFQSRKAFKFWTSVEAKKLESHTVSLSSSSFSSSRNRIALTLFTARSFQASSDTSFTKLSRAPQRGRFSVGQRPRQQGSCDWQGCPFFSRMRNSLWDHKISAKSIFTISFQNVIMIHRVVFHDSFLHAHFRNFLLTVIWPHMLDLVLCLAAQSTALFSWGLKCSSNEAGIGKVAPFA